MRRRVDRSGIVYGPHAPEKMAAARSMRREPTPAEERLWQVLRRGSLGGVHFRRQQVIDGFIADFYCHAAGLVVEVDGGVHLEQREADAERDAILAGRGLRVMRFANEEVLDHLDEVVERIDLACHPNP